MSAPRKSGDWNLCGCIQRVADQTLTRSDQKIAAKFFTEPQKAQDMRQSGSTHHEEFWRRYKEFGVSAAASCS
ncbi:hypothetical protein [Thalassovita sp.]|uniref:hypothetical protein n=1 Tax=Thalassovita sp. TaxID=1979401 RepID=UPI0029DE58B5|nr:hypothetical protein [Thalassovita sp.]